MIKSKYLIILIGISSLCILSQQPADVMSAIPSLPSLNTGEGQFLGEEENKVCNSRAWTSEESGGALAEFCDLELELRPGGGVDVKSPPPCPEAISDNMTIFRMTFVASECNQIGEYEKALELLEKYGLKNGWVQELEASEVYRPDFERDAPFDNRELGII